MKLTGVHDIFAAFDRFGDRLYGEDVSQREHALQAAQCAIDDNASETLIAAALLHDYGHMLEALDDVGDPQHDARHEAVGAAMLKPLFGPAVIAPIALHVAAKRYLCAAEPGYFADLSEASRHSLRLQGGVFTAAQAASFLGRAYAHDAIRLRRYDDAAKEPGLKTPGIRSFAPLLTRVAALG